MLKFNTEPILDKTIPDKTIFWENCRLYNSRQDSFRWKILDRSILDKICWDETIKDKKSLYKTQNLNWWPCKEGGDKHFPLVKKVTSWSDGGQVEAHGKK